MKYAIIIPDGAADEPMDELDGQTPLQSAHTPTLDEIASSGRIGTVANIPRDMAPGSDVAILSVLGYNPKTCYTGRAPLEAAANNIPVAPGQWACRCNLVTIIDGIMEDYSAGHISTAEAKTILESLQESLGSPTVAFHSGVSYRHLLILTADLDIQTVPPHDILGQPVGEHRPAGQGAEILSDLMDRAREILAGNEINAVRRDLGENPATDIWLWGQGTMPALPSFESRFGLQGAAITAVDLVRGLARLIGWDTIEVQGATGYLDTNYAAKGAAAVAALDERDLLFVHVEAPDEAGHSGDASAKINAIEQIDRNVIAPVLKRLRAEGDDWRILVLPDHPTPCRLRTHTSDPVPFALAGKSVEHVLSGPFSEQTARDSDLHIRRGCDLMEYFLTIR